MSFHNFVIFQKVFKNFLLLSCDNINENKSPVFASHNVGAHYITPSKDNQNVIIIKSGQAIKI